MRWALGTLAGLVLWATTARVPAAADGPNLVTNPDFESTGADALASSWNTWQRTNGAHFSTMSGAASAHAGNRCVAIKQDSTGQKNYAVWAQTIPAKPRTSYRFGFWVKTADVRPFTPYNEERPSVGGDVGYLDGARKNLPFSNPPARSANVLMTHDWARFEVTFRTPEDAQFVKINLVLANAAGTVYFDTISLVESPFRKLDTPSWLSDAIVYGAGPWEFARDGTSAFAGLTKKLPDLADLGVNVVYLQPIWEDRGGYAITDHYALFKPYGTEAELTALVADAHHLGIRVLLDLAGTIGLRQNAKLFADHRDWFILGPDGQPYHAWKDLLGLDTNLPAVQEYFAEFARFSVERFDVDGFRCDAATSSPPQLFMKVRAAIQKVKPSAILIAEDSAPVDFETAFDAVYDFQFRELPATILKDPKSVAGTVRHLEIWRTLFPAGGLQFRQFESQDVQSGTLASRCGPSNVACATAFATLLLTSDGVPMIYNGQEVGNTKPQLGAWLPPLDWSANPDAIKYRAVYKRLAGIRVKYAATRRGEFRAIGVTDDRVAAFARTLPGQPTVVTIINFSDAGVETRLDLSPVQPAGKSEAIDLLDDMKFSIADPKAFVLKLEPFKSRVLVVGQASRPASASR